MCEGVKGRSYGGEGVYICELGDVMWGVRCEYESRYTQE